MLPQLEIDLVAVRSLLVAFLKDEIGRAGFSRAVIGLSGGIDSAVVAWLAVEALGAENVTCILMPYRTSSERSVADAERITSILGVRHELVDISSMVDAFVATDGNMDRIRKGNIMARIRMIILYDRSAKEPALVIGTGNKTEILLGYSTLHGDAAYAINPVGDLYKSQIWALARYLGIPQDIIDKAPSADLWEGQTDEQELGFYYNQVDELLYYLVEERCSDEELRAHGFDEAFVKRVQRMIRRNQFKRIPPVIARISQRTVNADFRFPRDWGT